MALLRERGYRVLGPVVRDQAISIDEVHGADDLPEGWHDTQSPGRYRLERGDDSALFAWAVGQDSIKPDVFVSRSVVWRATTTEGSLRLEEIRDETPPTALVGARPCELAALGVLDRVLGDAPRQDRAYLRRRPGFVVVVECGSPSGTCFCASMRTGPAADGGFDLALTELLDDGGGHRFFVKVGSDQGAEVLAALPTRPARDEDASRGMLSWKERSPAWAVGSTPMASPRCSPATSSIRAGTTWPTAAWRVATAPSSARHVSAPRSRTRPTSQGRWSAKGRGRRASIWPTPISTAAPCGPQLVPVIGNG